MLNGIKYMQKKFRYKKLVHLLLLFERNDTSGKRVLDIQQGANLLQKFALKNAFICLLENFKEKINEKDIHNKMASLRSCLNKLR